MIIITAAVTVKIELIYFVQISTLLNNTKGQWLYSVHTVMVVFFKFHTLYAKSVKQQIKYEHESLSLLMELPISQLENVSQLGVSV